MADARGTIVLFLTCPGIGDFLKAVPAVRVLREKFPGRIITLVKRDTRYLNLLPVLPELGEIVFIDTKKDKLQNRLKPGRVWTNLRAFAVTAAARADAALIFRPKKSYGYWAKLAGIPVRSSLDHTGAETHWLRDGYEHIMNAYMSLAAPLGITADQAELVSRQIIALPPEVESFGEQYALQHFGGRAKTAALCIGGSIPMWRWGADNFMRLARDLSSAGHNIFIATGPYETDAWEQYHKEIEALPGARWEVNMPLLQVAGVVKRCHALVGGSTGLTHIAESVATPVIGLWAAGDSIWRPLSSTSVTLMKNPPEGWERMSQQERERVGFVRGIPYDMVRDLALRALEDASLFRSDQNRTIVV
jgi:ADP-heptose:LPS heptosyltransferase